MQEPAESDPAPQIETVIEVSHSTVTFDEISSSEISQGLGNDETPLTDEPLNRMERIAAGFGAWIITIVERWHLQDGPSFAVDDHPINGLLEPVPTSTENSPDAPTQ